MSDSESSASALIAGRYRLEGPIGHGGMATVFRARDEKLGRIVAVKVFTTGEPNPDDTARRVREMRLLAAANHPHLVTLFDAEWPTAATPRPGFLVMELVEGESLRRRIDRVGADPELARRVALELSGALAYLHQQGIVHRDLKPENILIDSATGATKLVDFGIAQFVGAERITTDGTVLGTAAYLSPEQVRGGGVTSAADVYALGLVVLECLTGKRVFPGPAVEAAIARLTNDPPIPTGLAPEWSALLADMTAREPEARTGAAAIPAVVAALDVPTLPAPDGDTITMAAPTQRDIFTGGHPSRGSAFAASGAVRSESNATAPTMRLAAVPEASVPAVATAAREGARTEPPRRRGRAAVLLGALAAVLVGGSALAFALDSDSHGVDAAPTSSPTPAPTVTVTARPPQPETTPVVQQAHVAPTPLSGAPAASTGSTGATGVTGAGTTTGAAQSGSQTPGHSAGRHAGKAVGHGKGH